MSNLQPGELLTYQRCNKATGCGPAGCGKGIAFRLTRTGAKMPLDPLPSPQGNVALIGEEENHEGIAEVLTGDRSDAYEGHRYKTHFETCEDGAKFRKNRPPKRSAIPAAPGTMANVADKLAEDQIKAHAAWFVRECREKKLTTREAVGELFANQHPTWWKDERNRKARTEWIQRVRDLARAELGFAKKANAA